MNSVSDAWLVSNDSTTSANDTQFVETTASSVAQDVGETFESLYKNEIYLSFVVVFSIFIVVSNGIVVTVVVSCRDLHLPTLWNIAFMASCDLLYGLHYITFSIPSIYIGKYAYSEMMIKPASITMTLLFGQNIFNIFISIVDRYIAVCWPLRYPSLMSAQRFLIAVLCLVAINIIRLCLIIFPNSHMYYLGVLGVCMVDFTTMMATSASVGLPVLTAILITVLLIKIAAEFQCRKKVHPTAPTTHSNQFTFTICLAAAVFIISYIPTCGGIVMNLIYGKSNIPPAYLQFSLLCVLLNSVWNVVIYATTYRPFRNAFLKLFCRSMFRDQARREANIAHSTGDSDTSWTVQAAASQ